jgi:endoglucanase
MHITADQQSTHLRWLHEVTPLPTAAGREGAVIRWVTRWLAERPDLACTTDRAGNLHIAFTHPAKDPVPGPPVYFTAHMDHPAFVVERVVAPSVLQLSFRGGVMDEYFTDAPVVLHAKGAAHKARLTGVVEHVPGPFKHYFTECEHAVPDAALGDVAVWDVGPPRTEGDLFHTLACDDLSALVAALAAMDTLRSGPRQDVRLLLTRAEEVGFIGAIAAARERTMQEGSRVIALENSRSFAESPIGGGPIVRVGDRLSVFSPALTDAVATRAEEIAGGAASVTASQKLAELSTWRWQRKLMAGGACEASVYCAFGYECTCVCLPLGNYHNMGDLENVQAGTHTTRPRVAPEVNSVRDFHGLVDLLVACGRTLPRGGGITDRFEKLWKERAHVL